MMKKSTRWLAMLMAGVLVLGISGCTGKQPATTEEATESPDVDQDLSQENLIEGGDFAAGIGNWLIYTNGGAASLSVEEEELKVHVANPGKLDYSVQPYYDGFALTGGCQYLMSFDVRSTVPRTLQWRIQVNGGDYHPYAAKMIDVTEEMTHVEVSFTMQEGSDPAPRMCINMGMADGCPEDLGEHDVFFDNFVLCMTDDSGKMKEAEPVVAPDVLVNQVGYLPSAEKYAVVRSAEGAVSGDFDVIDAETEEVVYSGTLTDAKENEASGEQTAVAIFTDLTEPGEYVVRTADYGDSYAFAIGDDVYNEVSELTFDMFRLQRCGEAVENDTFGHPACHTGTAVVYDTKEELTVLGGWHDAGDYGRYVVAGAKACADLMLAYEIYGDLQGDTGVLDEVKYELDWMLMMQREDGGVYHKITGENFPETEMPEDEEETQYLSQVSVAATGHFAAVMAMGARVYKDTDPEYAATLLAAAEKSYEFVETTDITDGFHNPGSIVTGEYPDPSFEDEKFWMLTELYKTTGDAKYLEEAETFKSRIMSCGLGWQKVWTYGEYAYLSSVKTDSEYRQAIQASWDSDVAKIEELAKEDAYRVSLSANGYVWGSNMVVANHAMQLLLDDQLYNDHDHFDVVVEQLNYILGTNTCGYCFVTGVSNGELVSEHPHHRISQVKGQAVPGMLIGGPDQSLEDPYAKATMQGLPNAACYADSEQSYSCNEITIYWNSPLVFMLDGIQTAEH